MTSLVVWRHFAVTIKPNCSWNTSKALGLFQCWTVLLIQMSERKYNTVRQLISASSRALVFRPIRATLGREHL